MGNTTSKGQTSSERKYFKQRKIDQLKYFSKLEGFLENKSD